MVTGKIIAGNEDLSEALWVRNEVFVKEQGFSAELDYDKYDQDAMHVVLYDDDQPVATGRMFYDWNGSWRIGRLAVLKEQRGKHLGDMLIRVMLDRLLSCGAKEVVLDSQMYAIPFYQKYGFVDTGERSLDEGCEHAFMKASAQRIEKMVFSGCCSGNCASCGQCDE